MLLYNVDNQFLLLQRRLQLPIIVALTCQLRSLKFTIKGGCDGKSKILCQWVAKDDCGNTTVKQWYIYINGSNGSVASPNSKISKNPIGEGDVNVYPNPTRGDLSIAINNIKVTKISIFDIAGRKIKDVEQLFDSNIQLNLGTEQRGIYTIQLHTEAGVITKKILLIE